VVFWLLQGQRDRGAEEAEGLALGAGRLGEHRHGELGAGEPDLIAGQPPMPLRAAPYRRENSGGTARDVVSSLVAA
jgi:hypothetical protein